MISSTKTKIGLRSFIFPCLEVEVPFTFHHQSPYSYIKVNTCLFFKCSFIVSLKLVIVFPWLNQLYHASLRLKIFSQSPVLYRFFTRQGILPPAPHSEKMAMFGFLILALLMSATFGNPVRKSYGNFYFSRKQVSFKSVYLSILLAFKAFFEKYSDLAL